MLDTSYTNFINNYTSKENNTLDFGIDLKTSYSTNITIEDWNTLQTYVSNLNSDSNTFYQAIVDIYEGLKIYKDNIKNYIDDKIADILNGDVSFEGDVTFNGITSFKQNVILNYVPSSILSAVNVGYIVNGYYDKTYIDNVVNQINSSIDTINATQNVIDIVPNYANLQNYVANHPNANILSNDKIEVLSDETQDGANTIYTAFLSGAGEVGWALVGSKAPYYSKTESDSRYMKKGETYTKEELDAGFEQIEYVDSLKLDKSTYRKEKEVIDNKLLEVDNHEKRLTNLELANKGITYTDEVDDSEALVKSVPTNAMPYALLNKVGGKTLKVVQVHKITKTFGGVVSKGVLVSVDLENQTIRYYGTLETDADYEFFGLFSSANIAEMPKGVVGHKYLVKFNLVGIQPTKAQATFGWTLPKDSVTREIKDIIVTCNSDSETNMYASVTIYKGASVDFTIQPQIFDLTAMFGAGNEPTSVEEFNKYFPQEYYPFDEGSFIESKPTNVKVIGSNLLNPQNFNPSKTQTINGVTFTINDDGTILCNGTASSEAILGVIVQANALTLQAGTYNLSGSDENACLQGKIIENESIYINDHVNTNVGTTFTLDKNYTFRFNLRVKEGKTLSNKVYKPMLVRGSTRMDFSPYKESNLPINVPFDDLGKSVGNVSNYIDFENKKFVKKVRVIDLGNLSWAYDETRKYFDAYLGGQPFVKADYYETPNFLCKKYTTTTQDKLGNTTEDKIISNASVVTIAIRDLDYNNATDFKNAVSGVLLYYELKNPTEEDVSTYLPEDNYIEVEGNGNIVFENTENTAIPSEVEYQVKVGV